MTATHDSILKVSRRGRLCDSAEQRSALVEAYPSSGLSAPRFAAVHGVAYQTLAAWVLKRKKSTGSGQKDCPSVISLCHIILREDVLGFHPVDPGSFTFLADVFPGRF